MTLSGRGGNGDEFTTLEDWVIICHSESKVISIVSTDILDPALAAA